MRRLTMALALTAMTLVGALWPPPLPASASPLTDANRGAVTLTVAPGSHDFPTWTAAFSGPFTAGGQSYVGSATATGCCGRGFVRMSSLTGSSSTGTMSGSCTGEFEEYAPSTIVGANPLSPPPAALEQNFTGVISFNCYVSINGRPYAFMGLDIALLPTTDANVFKGLYIEPADDPIAALPTVPLVSTGLAGASTDAGFGVDPSISFRYDGQITLGGETFHGRASGGASVSPGASVEIPPFALAADDSTDTLSATCSGQWRQTVTGFGIGAALSVLSCNGSVNGGPSGTTTLVSVYAETSTTVRPGETGVGYTGVFAGL
jgi:hypothetical protein